MPKTPPYPQEANVLVMEAPEWFVESRIAMVAYATRTMPMATAMSIGA